MARQPGSPGIGAAALRRYLLPDWRSAYARLAEIVTGCALLVGIGITTPIGAARGATLAGLTLAPPRQHPQPRLAQGTR